MSGKLSFDDLQLGMSFQGAQVEVNRAAMLEFAAKYDPQPMHLEVAAVKTQSLPDVIACGPITFALSSISMQPIVRKLAFLPGRLGFEMSFVAPVYAGDCLHLVSEITELRRSSKPGRGYARMKYTFLI